MRLIYLFVLSYCSLSENARIFGYIPTPSYSHQSFFHPLWTALAERGHDVVLLTTNPIRNKSLTTLHEIDLSHVYNKIQQNHMNRVITQGTSFEIVNNALNLILDSIEYEVSLPEVQNLIHNKSEHFDLIMVESLLPILFVFKERFNCPAIALTSIESSPFVYEIFGDPEHSVLYPAMGLPFKEAETIGERITAVLYHYMVAIISSLFIKPRSMQIIEKYFDKSYDIEKNVQEISMHFLNRNPIFNVVRPVGPATINLSGLHIKSEGNPLPKDIQEFLDKATEGVLYFSLGSNVKSKNLPNETLTVLLETFKKVPYKILWKFEVDTLPDKPSNVFIHKWLPQQDVLRHRNVKAFATQCGIQSLEETFFLKVPILGMPFLGDQLGNAKLIQKHQIGVTIDYETMTIDDLYNAIMEIMENSIYRSNIEKLSKVVKDLPMKPIDNAVWWTEYVIRYNGAPFSRSPKLPFYQYYYLDVFAVIFTIVFLIYTIFKWFIRFTIASFRRILKFKKD